MPLAFYGALTYIVFGLVLGWFAFGTPPSEKRGESTCYFPAPSPTLIALHISDRTNFVHRREEPGREDLQETLRVEGVSLPRFVPDGDTSLFSVDSTRKN